MKPPKNLLNLDNMERELESEFVTSATAYATGINPELFLPQGFKKHVEIYYGERSQKRIEAYAQSALGENRLRRKIRNSLSFASFSATCGISLALVSSDEFSWLVGIPFLLIFSNLLLPALIFSGYQIREERFRKQIDSEVTALRNKITRACVEASIPIFQSRWQASLHRKSEDTSKVQSTQLKYFAPVPAPPPQKYGVSHQGAEALCKEWMRHLGISDAKTTRWNKDGGIDIQSRSWIAQVKNHRSSIGVQAIREFAGILSADARQGIFFSSSGYTSGAIDEADRFGIGIFVFDASRGTLAPWNLTAKGLMPSNPA